MAPGLRSGPVMASAGSITDVDSTQRNVLGTRVGDNEANEFIYLSGVASTAAGDWVVIRGDYSTARSLNTPLTGPMAVAQAATIASTFGWYQTRGVTQAATAIATDASGDKKPLFLSSSAGRLTTTLAAGCAVLGAWAYGNPASNVGPALIDNPFAPGFILASA